MIDLLERINKPQIWDEQPVFCFTSDIDWASEAVLEKFFAEIIPFDIKPTLFVTHPSAIIESLWHGQHFDKGIHPNFLQGSTQGNTFDEVIQYCTKLTDTKCFRSHRAFDVTDTNHLLYNKYGFRYSSNNITIMQSGIKPVLHESKLINFPVFLEDGTHLYNEMDLDLMTYSKYFLTPGIKIISIHPMNFVLNSPTLKWMRFIKDNSTSVTLKNETIKILKNPTKGIGDSMRGLIEMIKRYKQPIYSLKELYEMI